MTRSYESKEKNARALEVGHDLTGGLKFLTRNRSAPPPDTAVYLDKKSLRALRDQIDEFLGGKPDELTIMDELLTSLRARGKELSERADALLARVSKPAVGTIVVGEGLTEAQKLNPPNLETLEKAREGLNGFSWLAPQEGRLFWETLDHRIANLISCVENLKKPVNILGVTLKSEKFSDGTPGMSLSLDSETKKFDPASAQALGKILLAFGEKPHGTE